MSRSRIEHARARLVEIATAPAGDPAAGALWIAAEDCPDFDVVSYLLRIDTLGDAVRRRAGRSADEQTWRDAMVSELFETQGLRGDSEEYDDPRNSLLHEVLDRRLGMPISLAIIYISVGRRLSLPVHGVNAPGHFLVRHGDVLLDAFAGGQTVATATLVERLHKLGVSNAQAELVDLISVPPDTRSILCRVLSNLKTSYLRRRDLPRALAAVDRLVTLRPDDPLELRDRGALLQRLDCGQAAARDLERYLDLVEDDPEEKAIRATIARLRGGPASLH